MSKLMTFIAAVALLVIVACDDTESRDASDDDLRAGPVAPVLAEAPGAAPPAPVTVSQTIDRPVIELEWDALIPDAWRPGKLMAEYNADELSDDDPRAQALMDKLKALWRESPVVPELDGRLVKLPGFVVPLETSTDTIGEFLLVPYYGACIHVPPPPANQTVHVVTHKGGAYRGGLFDAVRVTGTLRVERLSSELADAGYRIQDARVEPYD